MLSDWNAEKVVLLLAHNLKLLSSRNIIILCSPSVDNPIMTVPEVPNQMELRPFFIEIVDDVQGQRKEREIRIRIDEPTEPVHFKWYLIN